MVNATPEPGAAPPVPLIERAGRWLLVLYQLLAALVLLVAPALAYDWFRTPSTPVLLHRFTPGDVLFLFYIPYGLGLLYLLSGIWVVRRRSAPAEQAFAAFCTSSAVSLATLFDFWTTGRFAFVWICALLLAGHGLLATALQLPPGRAPDSRLRWTAWALLLPAVVIAALAYMAPDDVRNPTDAGVRAMASIYAVAALLFFLARVTFLRYTAAAHPRVLTQIRLLLTGALASFLPPGIWLLFSAAGSSPTFSPYLLLPLGIFPLVGAYALLRDPASGASGFFRQSLVYAALGTGAAAGYVLLVWGAGIVLGEVVPAGHPLLIGFLVFVLAALFNPLRLRLELAVDRLFFRGSRVFDERLQEFSQDLTQLDGLSDVLERVASSVRNDLRPIRLFIFLADAQTGQFSAAPLPGGAPPTEIRFSADSALPQALAAAQAPILLADDLPYPKTLLPERARLALLGARLFVPMIGRRRLIGWLALTGGGPYGKRELAYLDSLCDQAALAVERAQVVADLESRVREMNVLGRVAQGTNVTLDFDDILELIFAQTAQIVPVDHFRITLYDELTSACRHAFFQDQDERSRQQENQAIPAGLGLEQEVIRSRRAIATDDYDRECRRRSVMPAARGVYAWLGVPLIAGSRTIGALCLGSRTAAVVYTGEQQALVQAIADQAAGAIVKTQLLADAERRARQLESLNQAARSLTLVLELDPLWKRILESAVAIFHCRAGALFQVERETGAPAFAAVVGAEPALIGTRIDSRDGLVAEAIAAGRAVLRNGASRTGHWLAAAGPDSDGSGQNLLLVPLQVRDETIGVVELVDKVDGTPFTPADEQLLTAFSAQAAIAIQNARLFTMTDQALAARVDELSVMQRIDRELIASLDASRAIAITLEWAMRQSGADAGLIAVLDGAGVLKIADSKGYGFPADDPAWQRRLAELPQVQEALAKTQIPALQPRPGGALLPDGVAQLAAPILQEQKAIGILLLETAGAFAAETAGFVNRLCDHAAIAIANARLYAELQQANLAKSDFISFVSHELKTPMTSIKGYADLLSAGAVGPVNEAQAGFLATIRSNVDRMATLVSDLADISRIEAGRLRLDFGPVPVRGLVEEVLRSARRQVEEKSLDLTVEVPEDLPPVWGDRTRLGQVLANLVSNAVKYTPDGGALRVDARLVGGEAGNQLIEVAVRDTGLGIRAEEQPLIFTKFFRSEDLKARENPGTGLGLNITRSLVEMQGGRIWFESEFRRGSVFYFTVPVVG